MYSLSVSAAVLLKLLKTNKIKSSTEKQSSAIIVHKPKRTATSTRTIRTRQNRPYRLGAAPAGAIGPRGRCCPAATLPVSVVFACGVCCCFAENKQKKQTKYNHQPKNRALPSSSTNQSAQQRVREHYHAQVTGSDFRQGHHRLGAQGGLYGAYFRLSQ